MTPAEYDAWYASPRGLWIGETEWRVICRHLELAPGANVLDVGCGTGWFTRRFAAAGLDVTGVDIDPDVLAFARQNSPRDIPYIQGDAQSLPFSDSSFDQVAALTSLEFVGDWRSALREIVRVARSRVLLGLLNRHSLLRHAKGRNGGTGGYGGARWHTAGELVPVLHSLGLRYLRVESAVFLPSGTAIARIIENVLPAKWPWGAFLMISGEK